MPRYGFFVAWLFVSAIWMPCVCATDAAIPPAVPAEVCDSTTLPIPVTENATAEPVFIVITTDPEAEVIYTDSVTKIITAELRKDIADSKTTPRSRKDPALAGAMSFLIPGSGQIYAGKVGRGVLILAGEAILIYFTARYAPFAIPSVGYVAAASFVGLHLWQTYDATRLAGEYNARRQAPMGVVVGADGSDGTIYVAKVITF